MPTRRLEGAVRRRLHSQRSKPTWHSGNPEGNKVYTASEAAGNPRWLAQAIVAWAVVPSTLKLSSLVNRYGTEMTQSVELWAWTPLWRARTFFVGIVVIWKIVI